MECGWVGSLLSFTEAVAAQARAQCLVCRAAPEPYNPHHPPPPPCAAPGEGSKQLVLRSALPAAVRMALVQDRGEDRERGLFVVIAAIIDLAGGRVTSGEAWG